MWEVSIALNTSYVSGTVLGQVNKMDKFPAFLEVYMLVWRGRQ